MAKQLDSLLLDVGTTKSNIPKTSVETQGEKTGSSLFDSLLKQNFEQTSDVENSQEKSNAKVETVTPQTQKVQDGVKVVNEVEAKTAQINPNVETQVNTEANTQTKNEPQIASKVLTPIEETKTEETNENKKVSLLDRLILEAKKDVKTVNSDELKTTTNTQTKVNSENTEEVETTQKELTKTQTVTPQTQKAQDGVKVVNEVEAKTAQTNPNVETQVNTVVNKESNTQTKNEPQIASKVVTPTQQTETVETSENKKVSLLDRLILEAKKDVKTVNSDELRTTTNTQTKVNTENSEEVETTQKELTKTQIVTPQTQKVQDGVKVVNEVEAKTAQTNQSTQTPVDTEVNKEAKVQTENEPQIASKVLTPIEETKTEETNETKKVSLLDRLILEAKKDVKTVNSDELRTTTNTQTKVNTENSEEVQIVTPQTQKAQDGVKVVNESQNQTTQTNPNVETQVNTVVNKEANTQTKNEPQIVSKAVESNVEVKTENVNEKVAKELASLNLQDDSTTQVEVNISKDELIVKQSTTETIENKKSTSLMDQLVQKNRQLVFGNETTTSQKQIQTSEFLTSVYLSTQKSSISNQSMINKTQAVNIASNATTIADVQTSADMLDLGLEDIDVQKAVENIKKLDLEKVDRSNLLDKLAFNKNILNTDLKDMITSSVVASKALIEDTITVVDDLTLNANTQTVQAIQARIIGAKQEMSQMMSDIARQMYENYKPPVTAFRVNINPATLGAITILMKNDRDNAISISMNASNASTLDALLDNQSTLRTSLNKLFDENTKFNLNFGSSSDNNQSQNSGENQQNPQQSFRSTEEILNSKEESKTTEEKNIDYM